VSVRGNSTIVRRKDFAGRSGFRDSAEAQRAAARLRTKLEDINMALPLGPGFRAELVAISRMLESYLNDHAAEQHGAVRTVSALAALIPPADAVKALANGQTMVDYFRRRLS
jgi:hypothetical protein